MFNFFKKTKKEPESSKEVLKCLRKIEKDNQRIFREIERFKKESKSFVQKIGMVRFNPFKEIGSNQSFSVALLDGNNDGVVFTSHYSREFNRVYAKPIKAGRSSYSLSEEERKAIEKALSQNTEHKT